MWVLLIPVVTLLVALLWSATRSHPRRARQAMSTIEGYRRMATALERPVSAPGDPTAAASANPEPTNPEPKSPEPMNPELTNSGSAGSGPAASVDTQAGETRARDAASQDSDNRHVRVPDVLRGLRRSPRQAPRPARPSEKLDADPLADRDVVYPSDRDAPAVPSEPVSPATSPDAVIPATRAVADPADEPGDHASAGHEVSAGAEAPADGG